MEADVQIRLLEKKIKVLETNVSVEQIVSEIEKPLKTMGNELSKRGDLTGLVSEALSYVMKNIQKMKD
jgi:hypothetical protein